jgi:uncharacterized damage-inducible protein DinB
MTLKQLLLEQFSSCYNESNWFVAITTAVDGLSADDASRASDSSNNSVWKIVNHLIYWNSRYLNRFRDIPNPEAKTNNDATFEGERTSGSEEDWRATVRNLNSVMSEWETALKEADETKLEKKPIKNSEGTWYSYIGLINTHNAYHIGQIVSIRKQQGSWDPKKGVN